MTINEEYIGKKYNLLTIKEIVGDTASKKRSRCLCVCDCGNEITTGLYPVLTGKTKSCGCYRKEVSKLNALKLNNRKYPIGQGCSYCGATPIYAKGYCKNCYSRSKRNNNVLIPKKELLKEIRKQKELEKQSRFGLSIKKYEIYKKLEKGIGMNFSTEIQKKIFDMIVQDKMSGTQIAKKLNVSRQYVNGVTKTLSKQIERYLNNKVCQICGKVLYTDDKLYCSRCYKVFRPYSKKPKKDFILGSRKPHYSEKMINILKSYDKSFELEKEIERDVYKYIMEKHWTIVDILTLTGLTYHSFNKVIKSIKQQVEKHRGVEHE